MTFPRTVGYKWKEEGVLTRPVSSVVKHRHFPELLKAYSELKAAALAPHSAGAAINPVKAHVDKAMQSLIDDYGLGLSKDMSAVTLDDDTDINNDAELDALVQRATTCLQQKTAALQDLSKQEATLYSQSLEALSDSSMWGRPAAAPLVVGSASNESSDDIEDVSEEDKPKSHQKAVPSVGSTSARYDEDQTATLTRWFLAHKNNPYPSQPEKEELAKCSGLTYTQVSNWFTNKRKRHWTPVIKKRTRGPRDFFEFCVAGAESVKDFDETTLANTIASKKGISGRRGSGSGMFGRETDRDDSPPKRHRRSLSPPGSSMTSSISYSVSGASSDASDADTNDSPPPPQNANKNKRTSRSDNNSNNNAGGSTSGGSNTRTTRSTRSNSQQSGGTNASNANMASEVERIDEQDVKWAEEQLAGFLMRVEENDCDDQDMDDTAIMQWGGSMSMMSMPLWGTDHSMSDTSGAIMSADSDDTMHDTSDGIDAATHLHGFHGNSGRDWMISGYADFPTNMNLSNIFGDGAHAEGESSSSGARHFQI